MRIISKFCLIFIATFLSLYAGASDELYLVVGSNRQPGQLNNPWLAKYHKGEAMDFSHNRTFDGKAITIDLRTDTGIANHIPGADVCEYRAEKPIAAVFMELFPCKGVRTVLDLHRLTAQDPAVRDANIKLLSEKFSGPMLDFLKDKMLGDMDQPVTIDYLLMPHAIENLTRQMQSGAGLHIEHIPLLVVRNEENAQNAFNLFADPSFPFLLKASLNGEVQDGVFPREKQELCQQAIKNVQNAIHEEKYLARLGIEANIYCANFDIEKGAVLDNTKKCYKGRYEKESIKYL